MNTVTTVTTIMMAVQAVRGGMVVPLAALQRYINRKLAAATVERERRAAAAELHSLGSRELQDIGLDRGRIDAALAEAARERMRSRF